MASSRSARSPSPAPSTATSDGQDWQYLLGTPDDEFAQSDRLSSPAFSDHHPDFDPFEDDLEHPLPPLFPQLLAAQQSSPAAASPASDPFDLDAFLFHSSATPSSANIPDSIGQPATPTHGDDGPPPPGPKGFPLRYVCDMANGFAMMVSLQADGVNRQQAFTLAFDCPYKKTTVTDNHAIWKAAAALPGEHDRWIALGRTERGEWARFVRAMRKD